MTRHNRQVPRTAHSPGAHEIGSGGRVTRGDGEGRKAGSKVPAWKRKAKSRKRKPTHN